MEPEPLRLPVSSREELELDAERLGIYGYREMAYRELLSVVIDKHEELLKERGLVPEDFFPLTRKIVEPQRPSLLDAMMRDAIAAGEDVQEIRPGVFMVKHDGWL